MWSREYFGLTNGGEEFNPGQSGWPLSGEAWEIYPVTKCDDVIKDNMHPKIQAPPVHLQHMQVRHVVGVIEAPAKSVSHLEGRGRSSGSQADHFVQSESLLSDLPCQPGERKRNSSVESASQPRVRKSQLDF